MNVQLFAIARAVYVDMQDHECSTLEESTKTVHCKKYEERGCISGHTQPPNQEGIKHAGGVRNCFCRSIWGCSGGSVISSVNSATKWTTKSIFFEWKVCFSFSNVFSNFHASILLYFGYTNFALYTNHSTESETPTHPDPNCRSSYSEKKIKTHKFK